MSGDEAEDFVARCELTNAWPDGLHHSREVTPDDCGKGMLHHPEQEAIGLVDIEAVDARGPHGDEDVGLADLGLGDGHQGRRLISALECERPHMDIPQDACGVGSPVGAVPA